MSRASQADILEQENSIRREEAAKITFIGDKESLSSLLKGAPALRTLGCR